MKIALRLDGLEREHARLAPPVFGIQVALVDLMARKPVAVRYAVGHLSQRLLAGTKAVLPSRVFERMVMSYYGL